MAADIDIDLAPGWAAPSGASFARSGDQAFAFNAAGLLTQYPANTPRPAYDPVTLAYLGALFEPQSQNLCKNPGYTGATPGTIGSGATFPTDWGSGGIGVTADQTLPSEDGIPIWRIRFSGNSGGGGSYFWLQPIGHADRRTAAPGDVFTVSGMVRHWAGTSAHYNSGSAGMVRFQLDWFNSGGSNFASSAVNFTPGVSTTHIREILTAFTATAPANTATMAASIVAGVGPGVVDFTLDFAGFQVEKLAFATSRIYPAAGTSAITTRNADSLTWTNTDIAASEGAGFLEYSPVSLPASGTNTVMTVQVDDGDNSDRVVWRGTYAPTQPQPDALLVRSSSTVGDLSAQNCTAGLPVRHAIAWGVAGLAGSANGAVATRDASAGAPVGLARLLCDGSTFTASMALRRVRIFASRLTDAQLEVLSATGVGETSMPIFPSSLLQPSGAEFSLIGNTQVQTSPLDGTQQTLEMPGARWEFTISWEFLPEDHMRVLSAFLSSLRGRGRKFLWAPTRFYARKGVATGTPLVMGANQSGNLLATDGWTSSGVAYQAGDWIAVRDQAGRQWLHMLEEDAAAAGGIATLKITPPIRRAPLDNEPIVLATAWGRWQLTDDRTPPIQLRPPLSGAVAVTFREATS